ncbi:spermidine/putrescine ABC transporter substrate-binding protein [Anaerolineales bacterium HSG25]|nr:spermidine/putrescine ABC transporter substrate-binding protein [Anaerolineales bacterium HSG25]
MKKQTVFQPKVWFMLMGLILALMLAACGGNQPAEKPKEKPAKEEPAAESEKEELKEEAEASGGSEFCGDSSKRADTLNFFNWGDYIDEEIMTQFEAECGVKVVQDIFSSNEDMIAKVQVGNSGYDLVVPSDYAIDIMVKGGMLAEIDKSNIPNMSNLNPLLIGLYYDPDNKYSVPYQWGTTGIAYNITSFPDGPPDSWAALFDPEQVCQNSGFVSMLDDERESIGAVLMYLGYSYNDTDPAHHEEAKQILLAQKDCLASYDSDNFDQALAGEEIFLAHAWSGDTALGRDENENVHFLIPKEGGAIWQDNFAIPVDAPNQYTAELFINYVLDPEIGGQLSNYAYTFTPNQASEEFLDEDYFELLKTGGMLLEDSDYDRLEWIQRDDDTIIFSDTWTAVKAQ